MRILLFGLLIFCIWAPTTQAQAPTVPASIKIAGVHLKLTSGARDEIQKDVNALRASDKYFRIKLDRVNLYFPIIERILKEEGVPEDIKYLSVQESALISDAVSSANAVGYWQFKDFTGREVGLRVDNKVDERKNIVAATHGAAKYFKRNNFYFKNWIYSVSAYQAGPGGAKKYVDKENYGKDRLTITKNTHWYVLRFIAHVIAFKDEVGGPHSEGLRLKEYTKGAGKSLNDIAEELGVDADLLKDYNKWLRHGRIPEDKPYTVIVPVKGKSPKGLQKDDERPLTRTIETPKSTPTKYPEQIAGGFATGQKTLFIKINGIEAVMASKGDNIVSLAMKSGVSSTRLMKYNDLREGQSIQEGEIYYIRNKKNRSAIRYHVAQYGESLWDISQKYGIKLKKLARKNRMETTDPVKPGRLMWLRKKRPKSTPIEYHEVRKPQPTTTKPSTPKRAIAKTKSTKTRPEPEPEDTKPQVVIPANSEKILHVVQPKESLYAISGRYGVEIVAIMDWNNLKQTALSPGQELVIYASKTALDAAEEEAETPADTPSPNHSNTHVVQPGESLWAISKRYGVTVDELKSWNNLPDGTISIGQELHLTRPAKEEENQQSETQTSPPEKAATPIHEVQPGESLWAIAQKYNLTLDELRLWNGLADGDQLSIGQNLVLQAPEKLPQPKPTYKTYIVRGGDSLYKIARQHGMTVEELKQLNGLTSNALSVGDELKVTQ
ncbi:LysM peptidoglycan-binding domain-containing protein [Marinoscillum furvescens]|uniref:Membrane-bound lytic murein transglycosylase D n=1 Tax=Marinoscillum furvescens DSM 4134 TaxID=1122208 RepID=A0A3D9LGQ5_MARFU|nr:LysM peptidoglycan-binding domain-containing protein [Marinoscillum furvescens]REE05797.1 membrane-bound lytic murein transglycosylase D [Marinoscillum furvescens DSM 4134]